MHSTAQHSIAQHGVDGGAWCMGWLWSRQLGRLTGRLTGQAVKVCASGRHSIPTLYMLRTCQCVIVCMGGPRQLGDDEQAVNEQAGGVGWPQQPAGRQAPTAVRR